MSQLKCPECGRIVSLDAKQCDYCGFPLKKKEKNSGKVLTWVASIATSLIFIGISVFLLVKTHSIPTDITLKSDTAISTESNHTPAPSATPTPTPVPVATALPVGATQNIDFTKTKRSEYEGDNEVESVSITRKTEDSVVFVFKLKEHKKKESYMFTGNSGSSANDPIVFHKEGKIKPNDSELSFEIKIDDVLECKNIWFRHFITSDLGIYRYDYFFDDSLKDIMLYLGGQFK